MVGTFRTTRRKNTKALKQLQYSDVTPLYEELHKNIAKLKSELGDSSDLVIRILKLNEENSLIIAVIHIGGISDEQKINQNIIEPILKALFPTSLTFPFGEMITFTMIFPYLNYQNLAKKVGIAAVAFSGLNLMIYTIINISIVGAESVIRSSFPILNATSYINIAGFIQRIDMLVIIVMVIFGFFKISLYFFCAVMGSADLFRVKQPKQLIYPIGVMIVICSVIIAPNYIVHLHEGLRVVPYYISLPAQVVIPVLLLATIWIKKKIKAT
ncbi:GerAB/ArcD/ProY family transporter [Bacillus rhizoplanae]|uniref:GerAB/ArcD/ProY family transporter n=1 Tax=Bacillus rhizoplanae TaxID=2880966 RepID=UPI003D1A01AC